MAEDVINIDLTEPGEVVTWLLIGRAIGSDPDSPNIQVKIGYLNYDDAEAGKDRVIWALHDTYKQHFDVDADKIGVGVVPWVNELDDND
jgi:hypothetical protein